MVRGSGSSIDVWAQIYGSDNTVVASEFRVNTDVISGYQYEPSIGSLSNGGFAIIWRDQGGSSHNDGTGTGSGEDVWGRVFNADGTEAASEFRVNTTQFSGSQYQPSVAGLANGGFITVWRDDSGSSHNDGTGTGSGYDIWGHLYNNDGSEAAAEFRINNYTGSSQYEPDVTALKGGGFVVTWRDDSGHSGGSGADIRGQIFTDSGVAVGDEFKANSYVISSQYDAEVTGLEDGGFVVTWTSANQEGIEDGEGSGTGVYVRRFDADGTSLGIKLIGGSNADNLSFSVAQGGVAFDLGDGVDTLTLGDDADIIEVENVERVYLGGGDDIASVEAQTSTHQSDVIKLEGTVEAGDVYTITINQIPISYRVEAGNTISDVRSALIEAVNSTSAIFGVVTASLGSASDEISVTALHPGTEEAFRINSYLNSSQEYPSLTSLADGSFIATWSSSSQDGSSWGVYGQHLDSSGVALGEEFQVNSYTSSQQRMPSVSALEDGGFIVTWMDSSGHSGGSSWDVRGQLYDGAIAPVGEEFRVNSYTSSSQYDPDVVGLKDGGFVVTWRDDSGHDGGSGEDVWARVFNADGSEIG